MQIGQLATTTGFSRDTLRFYEKCGLLWPQRGVNGYRNYPEETVAWLRYVRLAQKLGFSLAEIASEQASLLKADPARLRVLLQTKLSEIDIRLAAMQEIRDELSRRIEDPALAGCSLQRCQRNP